MLICLLRMLSFDPRSAIETDFSPEDDFYVTEYYITFNYIISYHIMIHHIRLSMSYHITLSFIIRYGTIRTYRIG